jgi:hypothetical protein
MLLLGLYIVPLYKGAIDCTEQLVQKPVNYQFKLFIEGRG